MPEIPLPSSTRRAQHVHCLRRLQPQALRGDVRSGYSNTATGFSSNIAYATAGSSDSATFYDSASNDTFSAYDDYENSGQTFASMTGSYGNGVTSYAYTYTNSAKGFGSIVANSINGGSDTAQFFHAAGNITFYAYADYQNSGKELAGMHDTAYWYLISANGFATDTAASPPAAAIRPNSMHCRRTAATRPPTRSPPTRTTRTAARRLRR